MTAPCRGCGAVASNFAKGFCRRCYPQAPNAPSIRECRSCGRLAPNIGHGQCSACYQRDPSRLETWVAGALHRLGACAPSWFGELADDLSTRGAVGRVIGHLRCVERVLAAGSTQPREVVEALRTSGRSPGDTARFLDEFFARVGVGTVLDEPGRTAAGRRGRRLDRLPPSLRRAVDAFVEQSLRGRSRAHLLGGRGLADGTIEARIMHLAAFAEVLETRGVGDWASVTAADVEAFVRGSASRLACARAFFAFAKQRKLILVDPTTGIGHRSRRGFAGRTVTINEQRRLFKRWACAQIPPNERVVGLLCLLHAASSVELRALTMDDINLDAGYLKLGRRPHPVPLDPMTVDAVRAVLEQRAAMRTDNPHLLVTRATRWHDGPCSSPYVTHVLDRAGTRPAVLRHTRLADLAHHTDPRLMAAAIGITEQGALHYLIDAVDREKVVFSSDL